MVFNVLIEGEGSRGKEITCPHPSIILPSNQSWVRRSLQSPLVSCVTVRATYTIVCSRAARNDGEHENDNNDEVVLGNDNLLIPLVAYAQMALVLFPPRPAS